MINATSYGVVGDGSTNDTAAFQSALTAGASLKEVVYAGSLKIKVTAGVSMSGPGLVFDQCSSGASGDPGIFVSGTGYTALTVTGSPSVFVACIYGSGNTANGVAFGGPCTCDPNMSLAVIQEVRAYNLDGFGVQLNKCWDSLFGSISVELCGNSSVYAFSVNDAGDTTNQTHVLRLQVERATCKAIWISALTLACKFDNIHSEQAIATGGVDTWYLGGSRSEYNVGAFAATVPANATLHLRPGNTHYFTFMIVGDIRVLVDTNTNTAVNSFNGFELQGRLDIGIQTGYDPNFFIFNNCKIAVLTQSSPHAAATFVNCTILDTTNGDSAAGASVGMLTNVCTLLNSDVTCSTTLARSGDRLLKMIGSTIRAGVTYSNHSPIRMSERSQITGTVTRGDSGNVDLLAAPGCTVGGSSSWVGVPTDGAHIVGEYHTALLPSSGQPLGWVCTAAGTPGTWASIGNL